MFAVAGVVALCLLALARGLTPSPAGRGTHEQLGLAPCWILQRTGVPCPSCGMTTAWAHVVRGELRQAVRANVGGTIAAIAALFAAPWLVASAIRGRWIAFRLSFWTALVAATAWLAVVLIAWAMRFAVS
ncbi:DUF2752 domain-containing protein [Pirellulales bacterium]|nr:DUF2752 domain-containing protein [Pirellulales bacterium]